jgi:flavin reductase
MEAIMDIQTRPADPAAHRKALRHHLAAFATGVSVITVGGRDPHGMTANALTSVSLDPPMLLVCIGHQAIMHDALVSAGLFGISVLGSQQEHIARYFANSSRPLGHTQFEYVDWTCGDHTGAPLITGALAQFECAVSRRYEGGDHTIFLGNLLSVERQPDAEALVFLNGGFHRIPVPSEVQS